MNRTNQQSIKQTIHQSNKQSIQQSINLADQQITLHTHKHTNSTQTSPLIEKNPHQSRKRQRKTNEIPPFLNQTQNNQTQNIKNVQPNHTTPHHTHYSAYTSQVERQHSRKDSLRVCVRGKGDVRAGWAGSWRFGSLGVGDRWDRMGREGGRGC